MHLRGLQCTDLPRRPGRKNSPSSLSRHFLKVMRLSVIRRIWRQRSASEISTAGLVGFRFLLDSGLHVADDTEAPRPAARVMCQECRPFKLGDSRGPLGGNLGCEPGCRVSRCPVCASGTLGQWHLTGRLESLDSEMLRQPAIRVHCHWQWATGRLKGGPLAPGPPKLEGD
jgi:hypothetical protein